MAQQVTGSCGQGKTGGRMTFEHQECAAHTKSGEDRSTTSNDEM